MSLTKDIERILDYDNKFKKTPGPAKYYAFDKIAREFLGVPNWMPLLIYAYHGVNITTRPEHYLKALKRIGLPVFVNRKAQADELRKNNIEAFVFGTSFVNYRRFKNIEQNQNAEGTIAFPAHSTHHINVKINWDKYAESLLKLPDRFQPVAVCFYWKDLLNGFADPFIEKGLSVHTAGHMFDPMFPDKFYSIIRKFKYATGNHFGSTAYYAIEMGIPFFLYGDSVQYNDQKLTQYNNPSIHAHQLYEQEDYLKLYNLFPKYPFDEIQITQELRDTCYEKMGLNDHIDRKLLKRVVYKSFFKNGLFGIDRPFKKYYFLYKNRKFFPNRSV